MPTVIHVIGCNHGIQPRDPDWLGGDTNGAAEQKARFKQLIEASFISVQAEFVAEEWGLADVTTAHALADRCTIPWCNINTCHQDLDRLGIPHDYVNGDYTPDQKRNWNAEREKVMLRNIKACIESKPNGVVICGFDHMSPLVELLRGDGIEAEEVNYRKKEWYRRTFEGDS